MDVEGELDKIAGSRRHLARGIAGGGRSGGGYVVGNA